MLPFIGTTLHQNIRPPSFILPSSIASFTKTSMLPFFVTAMAGTRYEMSLLAFELNTVIVGEVISHIGFESGIEGRDLDLDPQLHLDKAPD